MRRFLETSPRLPRRTLLQFAFREASDLVFFGATRCAARLSRFLANESVRSRSTPEESARKYPFSLRLEDNAASFVGGRCVRRFSLYGTWAQTFDMKNVGEMPERSTVYDVDGKIYSRLAGANRLKVSLSEVSPEFIAAVLAREDTRFYDHKGIDWRGVLRALSRDIVSMKAKEGASSLTMQLARNSLPLGGRTFSRKLLEAMVALRIEREFTKQQILELYVNRIYFGSGCYGVETASQAYFGKNASKLNLSEAALLAGLIRSPNRFSPLKNPEGAAIQRDAVLDRMVALKKLRPHRPSRPKKQKSSPIRSECHRSRRTMRWTLCSAP